MKVLIIGGLILLVSISSVYIIQADSSTTIGGSFSMESDSLEWSEYWRAGNTRRADVNSDMIVGPGDLSGVASHFMESGKVGWIPADVNDNGEVGPEDLSGVASHYMEKYGDKE